MKCYKWLGLSWSVLGLVAEDFSSFIMNLALIPEDYRVLVWCSKKRLITFGSSLEMCHVCFREGFCG
jgi:hypothetical protein